MSTITIERIYDASLEDVWELWTTKHGIESWWAPDGFSVAVDTLELEPGGRLLYSMTATGAPQVEFMRNAGMPLTTRSRKTFTEVVPTERLAYTSVVDFVPGVEPYEFLTVVDFAEVSEGVRAAMTIEPLHDHDWTQRLVMGRENELDNLAQALAARA
jgi:uncharacterized protein YndB with AHSA1/START domain